MRRAGPREHVLDVACGTGLVSVAAAEAVGPDGRVLGVDLSGRMVEAGRRRCAGLGLSNVAFERMEAESLDLADGSFDVVLCALGLMYVPEPELALREMRRVLRPGGRMVVAVWGERAQRGWSAVFPIVDEEVVSQGCPLFFRLGQSDTLRQLCADAQLAVVQQRRIASTMDYDDDEACDAAFVGGPVALAWSRFDEDARTRVRERYLDAIASWKYPHGYRVPGEFVIVSVTRD